MIKSKFIAVFLVLSAVVTACFSAPMPEGPSVDDIVAATLTALTAEAEQGQVNALGSINGTLGYPSESVPAMRVAIFNVQTGQPVFFDTLEGQTNFQIDELPAGNYQVVAYTLGGGSFPSGLAGGYTQYIVCGANENCTDHTLAIVTVSAGQITSGIHVGDWILIEGSYPPMPGSQPASDNPSDTGSPADQPGGIIGGNLSFPSETIPPLAIVAFRVDGSPTDYYFTVTEPGDTTFEIANIPNGEYYIVAYLMENPSFIGGYTRAVLCGLSINCTDHTLIPVPIIDGTLTGGITPGDWYAPAGTYPPYPLP